MNFGIEKTISNFVQNQFPQFYQEEGDNFILFMKAYYEWMEETGQPVREARELLNYRDIDLTIEKFLEFFQKKYLYGIPFNIISKKRFLLKHILDVYRSKGTIQCYKLLFRLIYNDDIEIYLPGRDILRASDGTWVEPKYLEITENLGTKNLIGKPIVGVSSGATAIVESYIREEFNRDIFHVIYISNLLPRGGDFIPGEKIVPVGQEANTTSVSNAPTVLGSLNEINIINGGQNYNIGDVIKILHTDLTNNAIVSSGTEGLLRVTELSTGVGSLNFDIISGGFGYMANATSFVYKNSANGQGASFSIAAPSNTQTIQYNTDIICDYMNLTIDTASYGFPASASANQFSNVGTAFSYTNNVFGTIVSLTNIKTGNQYTASANVFVRSCQYSKTLQGTISYSTSSNTVTGTSTIFDSIYANNDVIYLQANSSLGSSIELAVIKNVVNATSIVLYGPPKYNSTASAKYRAAPVILPSNYATYEPIMYRADGTINGVNERINASAAQGKNVVSKAVSINSGKGYLDGESVKAYLYGAISNNVIVLNGGNNYTNGDLVIFAGGGSATSANAFVTTNGTGSISNVTVTYVGSGYTELPTLRVKSANGTGAQLSVTITEYNTVAEIIGRVKKAGIGKGRGYWSTTRGFLNSDKYIQDSNYYQDYSYEIRVSELLDKYKNILYNTFHTSGTELFGRFLKINNESSSAQVLYEQDVAILDPKVYINSDSTHFTADNARETVDELFENLFTSDLTIFKSDSTTQTADQTAL